MNTGIRRQIASFGVFFFLLLLVLDLVRGAPFSARLLITQVVITLVAVALYAVVIHLTSRRENGE